MRRFKAFKPQRYVVRSAAYLALDRHQVAELATRIRKAENEVKNLVEGYETDGEGEEHPHRQTSTRDLERNEHGMDEGSDDDADSDDQSVDALEERWSELEVCSLAPDFRLLMGYGRKRWLYSSPMCMI